VPAITASLPFASDVFSRSLLVFSLPNHPVHAYKFILNDFCSKSDPIRSKIVRSYTRKALLDPNPTIPAAPPAKL
jgi:hypothetical protein